MPQTVRWLPASGPSIIAYKLLYSDDGAASTFTELATILNVTTGPNWDPDASIFFYEDPVEIPYRLYRLQTVNSQGVTYEDTTAAPFGPNNDPQRVPVQNVYPLDHNTGGTNALQYVDQNGAPISSATVRVYRKSAWDAKQYSQVVGLTKTRADGGWEQAIFVEAGLTYVIHYTLPNQYGPDTVEVTV